MIACESDEQIFSKAMKAIGANDENASVKMDLIWMYITNDERCGSMDCVVDDKSVGRLYQQLMDVYDCALSNSVILLVTGKKDFKALDELRLKLAQAVKTGNLFQAEGITQQIRAFDSDSKQYPFWITTVNK